MERAEDTITTNHRREWQRLVAAGNKNKRAAAGDWR